MEIENFDYDWKQNRSRIPEMTYNFKRIERYNHAKPPRFLVRFLDLICQLFDWACFNERTFL